MNDIHFKGKVKTVDMETPSSKEQIEYALQIYKTEIEEETIQQVEKELKKKYSQARGKDIEATLYCVLCTKHFKIKRKNNKSDATAQQLCPHTILKVWEVDHDSS
jgi:predicted aldo/keto reductase-like oxidoreductase